MTLLSSTPAAVAEAPPARACRVLLGVGLLAAPALLIENRRWWVGPVALLVLLTAVLLIALSRRRPEVEPSVAASLPVDVDGSPARRAFLLLSAVAVLAVYATTLFVFRKDFDIWEQFSWCAHSYDPYGGFENPMLPPVAEVMERAHTRWHGPHVTHGLLHSRAMALALRPFLRHDATRRDLAAAMRVVNTAACLLLVPLLYRGFVRVRLLEDAGPASWLALLSPGVLMVGSKGHWLGISYGIACLALYALARFLSGSWGWLAPFLGAWAVLQALYSSSVLFAAVVAAMLVAYGLASRDGRGTTLVRAAAAIVPAGVLVAAIGGAHPQGLRGHFSGNGETLLEIARAQNPIELQRFAGYWDEIAPRYGLSAAPSLELVTRAGLGMAARNVENGAASVLGTGRFYSLWQSPNEGRTKSLGFVLPWLAAVGGLLLAVVRRGRLPAPVWWLAGTATVLVIPFLLTWDLSAHRLFGATLVLAALAGVVSRGLGDTRAILGPVAPRHVLVAALVAQIALLVVLERAGRFTHSPWR